MERFTKREIVIIIIFTVIVALTVFQNYKLAQSKKLLIEQETDNINNNYEQAVEQNPDNNSTEEKVEEPKIIVVDVCGAVVNPKIVKLIEGDRVIDAVNKAGGLKENADIKRINLAMKAYDGQKIIVPEIGEELINPDAKFANVNYMEDNKININTASKSELESLDGIGDALSERIIRYREENNGFKSIEEIMNVSGIGEKRFQRIKDSIKIK